MFRENVADPTEVKKDEFGLLHCVIDGKDYILHQPLNVEREKRRAERNRQ